MFIAKLQCVQLAFILLTIVFTSFKLLALLTIEYRNLDLFLLRNLINKLSIIILRVTLIKIKDQEKKRDCKFLQDIVDIVDY